MCKNLQLHELFKLEQGTKVKIVSSFYLNDTFYNSLTRLFCKFIETSNSHFIISHNCKSEFFYHHIHQDLVDTMLETRKKSLDYYQFPGFRHGEFIELPAQLEAPPILHKVTTAQDFNVRAMF